MKKIIYIFSLFTLLLNTSCEKWLDVQPRTKVKSADLLLTEQGYKDALIGVYTLLKSESLYAKELTFGFMDAVSGQYDTYNNSTYGNVANWKYKEVAQVRSMIDNIWNKMYNAIANLNNILDNIDKDKGIFTDDNYYIIKGEALGLRAFLHFDLLRLFASSDLTKQSIPLVRSLSTQITESLTGEQTIGLILSDLSEAISALEKDPIKVGKKLVNPDSEFLNNRQMRFNYYAAKATAARAYLWAGNKTKALENALDVINAADQIFPWITTSNISATEDKNRDFTFSTEHIFSLNVYNLKDISNRWFYAALSSMQLFRGSYYFEKMYEKTGVGVSDYRLIYTTKMLSGTSNYAIYKYYQPDGYKIDFAARIPLIKKSEMYYIAAECKLGVDNTQAINYLNMVRNNRGITTNLATTLSETAIISEILKEYRKEFQAEGQIFHYCKRTKMAKFPDVYNSATESVYVLPMPEKEIEYGFRGE